MVNFENQSPINQFTEKTIQEILNDFIKILTLKTIQINNVRSHFLPMFITSLFQMCIFVLVYSIIFACKFKCINFLFICSTMFISNLMFSYTLSIILILLSEKSENLKLASFTYCSLLSLNFYFLAIVMNILFIKFTSLIEIPLIVFAFCSLWNNLKREVDFSSKLYKYLFLMIVILFYILYYNVIIYFFMHQNND